MNIPLARILQIAAAWMALSAGGATAQGVIAGNGVQVEDFFPQGYVKSVRQVTARFSAPMVALGDPQRDDPFTVDCPTPGKGRWADARNWVYDFDRDLAGGVSCQFALKAQLKALDGAVVSRPAAFEFNTGGPAIVASLPSDGWQDLDEEQVFLLKLDAPATAESIRANAYCVIEGVAERVPVEVLADDARRSVLEQRKALGYDYLQLLWKDDVTTDVRVRNRSMEQADALVVAVRCQRRLPPATQVRLKWGGGIATASGLATNTEQQLAFRVRPAFTAQVECSRVNARAGCIPLQPIEVNFSAPVPRAQALAIRLQSRGGSVYPPTIREPKEVPSVMGVSFPGPFPEDSALTVRLPRHLVDDAGRVPENASRFPVTLRVDRYPPLAKFSGDFGILESREGGVLPVTLRNVEPELSGSKAALEAKSLRLAADPAVIANWLRRVEVAGAPTGEWIRPGANGGSAGGTLKRKLEDQVDDDEHEDDGNAAGPKRPRRAWRDTTGVHSVFRATDATSTFTLQGLAAARPEEVIGIPLKQSGFYVVEIASRMLGAALLGRDQPRYVATSALVTDLAVHFEWGREDSRVWVTRLSDGAVVSNAELTVTDYCSGAALWRGHSDRDGIAAINQSLGEPHGDAGCDRDAAHPLLVVASKAGDFSFTQSGWNQGIGPYQFALPVGSSLTSAIVHTVLDRTLFRAGETVSMKHFLRRHFSNGIWVPEDAGGQRTVKIAHQGSGQSFTLTASFGSDGVAESQWKIPDEAKLGDYVISIDGRSGGQFKVEQFRLPLMHASVSGPARPLVDPKQAQLDLHVAYLSGGGASGLEVKLRTLVEPRPQRFPEYADYQFGGEPVREGVSTEGNGPADYDFEANPERATTRTQILPVTLDASGSARVTINQLPPLSAPAQLTAELEYTDPNGETLSTTGHVRLVPSSLSLGIRREGWVASAEQLRFRVVALDLDGKPQAQQPVSVSMFQSEAYSYRKRLIGGFYAYETTRATRRLATTCSGVTDRQGLLTCEVAPGVSGQIIVRAETHDAQGALAGATTSLWVAGRDEWWFGGTSGDRMDLLPEKKEYESGETARFQVRMPFRSATALVSVEREGVLSSFVTHLSGTAPVIELPIDANYAPNVYVSVLAVRGRVAHAEAGPSKSRSGGGITALVDLNKPAYRLGIAMIKVGWRPHRLDVQVLPEQSSYKVRERANVRIHVATASGSPLPAGSEVAVAAVDEALLDLAPNSSWDLLESMMGQRGLEVWTSTAQMQVVGKRHYGRKALPHGGGGGGGRDRARELFDSLLLWRSRLRLDANGDGTVSIPLNDSLSAFRIVAVAHGGAQLFGTGSARINTTQDVMVLSGLPPLVRAGDRYAATFTVRNTTTGPLAINLQATVTPRLAEALEPQRLTIPGGQSRDVSWTISAPANSPRLSWDVTASVVNGTTRDRLKVDETVIAAYPVRTYQATIAQLTAPVSISAERPQAALPGGGGVEVSLQPTLGGGLEGVREFMSLYPYTCLEQLVSRTVALRDRAAWDALMRRLPAYMDDDGLLKFFATDRLQGDDTLTAYVLAIANEAGWSLADADRDRLVQALTRFATGRIVRRSALPTADLSIRKLAAIEALARYGAAESAMLDSISIEPNLWPTSAVLDWIGILQRVPGLGQADDRLRAALGILRSRLNFQGTTLGFSTDRSDALWWLMISGDSNANRLLLAVLDRPDWREDVPRLVRGALGRQQSGHWNTTVANAWGVLALERFSAGFEAVAVAGTSEIRYGREDRRVSWPQATGTAQVALPWQSGRLTLNITHAGTGAPWAMIRATAALPLDKPLSTGFRIARTVTAVEQSKPGVWTPGDVVRVHLELTAQSDMSWVVVDDPIPAGAMILGTGLGGQSSVLRRDDRQTGWAWLAFDERRFDSYRAYYQFVPKGQWTLDYTVRLNNPGTFLLPATRVEAMYAPEMLGESPNAAVVVKPRS
jgi:uncharacterized protein YfaS (alpha-2-macroglobulin family)